MSQSTVLIALLWSFYPLWLAAGWFDYHCHRRTDLPHTTGLREARLHLLMLAQVGSGLLLTLACAPSPLLLAVLLALAIAHLLTSVADTRRADGRRRIGVLEQHVHGFLDVLPLLGLALYLALHAEAFDAAGAGAWTLRWRDPNLPAGVWAAVLAPAAVFAIAPGIVEYLRAWRAERPSEAGA